MKYHSKPDLLSLADRLSDPPTDYQTKHGLNAVEMMVWHQTCVEAARILRDVHEWHQNVKAFGLHSKSAMGTAHRLEAALDALEKDDGY